jgi:hypothetical protein
MKKASKLATADPTRRQAVIYARVSSKAIMNLNTSPNNWNRFFSNRTK